MIIKLVLITIATLVYYTFHVLEDVIDSNKEALIRRLRIKANEKDQLADDLLLKEKWHFYNWVKIAIFAILSAFLAFGISFLSIYILAIIGFLRIVYFNPFISIRLGSTFFHIGQGKWERLFEGKEKLYYFTNLTLLILCYSLIILKIY